MEKCSALTTKGTPCINNSKEHGLCGIHLNSRKQHGPHQFEIDQMRIYHKVKMAEFRETTTLRDEEYRLATIELIGTHSREMRMLKAKHREIMENTGIDPDAEANRRKAAKREEYERRTRIAEEQREQIREQIRMQNAQLQREHIRQMQELEDRQDRAREAYVIALQRYQHVVAGAGAAVQRPLERDLRDIVEDNQNVHTTEVVTHMKKIIKNVRKIPVPEEYQWDKNVCSHTPGEIILECKLTQAAAWQMMSQYAQNTSIYNIEEGIYGKVLDCVWQYIKSHAEKESLVSILKHELEDNIGMCAQGNLTRICNILSGYMEDMAPPESLSEKLGRLFAPLMEIEDDEERIEKAKKILTDNNVPMDKWADWVDALLT